MNRIFLGLAVTNMTLLVAAFGVGLIGSSMPRGPGAFWPGLHVLFGLSATMTCLLVHSVVYTYFLGTGKWVKEVERVYGMPGRFVARSKRNKRRAFPFEFWSMMLVGGAAWLGAAADTMGGHWAWWHLGMAAVAIGFNLGAHAVEYLAIVGQYRLLQEVKLEADRIREASLATGPGR